MKKTLLLVIGSLLILSIIGMQVTAQSQSTNSLPTPVATSQYPPLIIDADGSVSPSTAPIQRNGDIYTLTDNVIGGIIVKRNNTVFDGNGYTLSGWSKGFGGVALFLVRNVTLKNLVLTQLETGIQLTYASNCIVTNNTITAGVSWLQETASIYVEAGSSNVITQNNLVNNVNATFFSGTSNNIIVANNFTGSSGVACLFYKSSNNTFYHNNFVNNHLQILDTRESNYPFVVGPSVNIWDNGYPSGGNYWSDYSSQGTNGNGIGDSPYVIDANNKDNYPLISQFNVQNDIEELPSSTPTPTHTGFAVEVTPPTIAVIITALAVVIGLGLLVYFKKHKPNAA